MGPGIHSNCCLWRGNSVSQQTFIGHLLCTRHCAGCGDTVVNKAEEVLCSWGYTLIREAGKKSDKWKIQTVR